MSSKNFLYLFKFSFEQEKERRSIESSLQKKEGQIVQYRDTWLCSHYITQQNIICNIIFYKLITHIPSSTTPTTLLHLLFIHLLYLLH
jgi:hypothetical protein